MPDDPSLNRNMKHWMMCFVWLQYFICIRNTVNPRLNRQTLQMTSDCRGGSISWGFLEYSHDAIHRALSTCYLAALAAAVCILLSVSCDRKWPCNFFSARLERPSGPRPPLWGSSLTLRHTLRSRTPLDEWSTRLRYLYLTSMPQVGFEPVVPASKLPKLTS